MTALTPRHLATVERWTLILTAVVSLCAMLLLSRPMAVSVVVGSGLMSLNMLAIRKLSERLFDKAKGEPRPGAALLLFNVKMFALIGAVYVALRVLHLEPIGFLLGVSIFPVAIVLAALRLNLGDEPSGEPSIPPSGDL